MRREYKSCSNGPRVNGTSSTRAPRSVSEAIMATLTVTPGWPLRGTISVPGDKSVTHRAMILTALAEGQSIVSKYCQGDDCLNTMRAFRALGIQIDETPHQLTVHGKGFWGLTEPNG